MVVGGAEPPAPLLAASVVVAGLAAILSWLGAREVLADLGRLEKRVRAGVRTLGERETWDEPLDGSSRDEVADLAAALEAMRRERAAFFARDRTAREKAEAADRYKDEFLHAVSHELRTPLNAILGFAGVLLEEIDGPLSESQREDVRMIHASGKHLLRLFEDVLDLSAMATGRVELEPETIDLRALLGETAALLRAQKKDRPVEIRTEIAGDLPAIEADPVRIRQIVMNLATNALKYTERGAVTLAASAHPRGVEIEVRDTGVGIPEEDLGSIFEAYRQLGTQRKRGSAGLGLAIVRELTALLGGDVRVQSEVGRGSSFFVVLPRALGRDRARAAGDPR